MSNTYIYKSIMLIFYGRIYFKFNYIYCVVYKRDFWDQNSYDYYYYYTDITFRNRLRGHLRYTQRIDFCLICIEMLI